MMTKVFIFISVISAIINIIGLYRNYNEDFDIMRFTKDILEITINNEIKKMPSIKDFDVLMLKKYKYIIKLYINEAEYMMDVIIDGYKIEDLKDYIDLHISSYEKTEYEIIYVNEDY